MPEKTNNGGETPLVKENITSPHAIYELRGETVVHIGDIIEKKQRLQEKREKFSNKLSSLKHNFNYHLDSVLLQIDIPKGGNFVLWTKEKEEKCKNDFMKLFPVIDEYIEKSLSLPIDSDTQDIYDKFLDAVGVVKENIQYYINNIKTGGFSRFTKDDEEWLRVSILHLKGYVFTKNLFPEIFASRRKSESEITRGYHDLACG